MTEATASENAPDEVGETPKPQMEHEWLHRLIGNWSFAGECIMDPSEPPTKSAGDAKAVTRFPSRRRPSAVSSPAV